MDTIGPLKVLGIAANGVEPKPHPTLSGVFSDFALQQAGHCWCDEETQHLTMIPELAQAFAKRLEAWMDTAAQEQRNADFYRGLVDKCAEQLGPVRDQSYIRDDGSVADSPLRAKVPELVAKLATAARKWMLVEETANKPAPDSKFKAARIAGEVFERLQSLLEVGYLELHLRPNGLRNDSPKVFTYRWHVQEQGRMNDSVEFAVNQSLLVNHEGPLPLLAEAIAFQLKARLSNL